MRWLLLISLLALVALPFFPTGDRTGVAAGWSVGMLLEAFSLRARLRAQAQGGSILPALVGGFLVRLSLLLGGTVIGEFTSLWSAVAFLLACAAAFLVGEGLAFVQIGRSGGFSRRNTPS